VFELETCWLRAPPALSWWSGALEYESNLCRSRADDMVLAAEDSAVSHGNIPMGMGPWVRRLLSLASPCCSSSGHVSDFRFTRGRRSRQTLGRPRERFMSLPSLLEAMLEQGLRSICGHAHTSNSEERVGEVLLPPEVRLVADCDCDCT
jgi:hypothetical protein